MAQYQVRGIVLNRKNIGEKETLATLYTLENGKLSFAARGTKKLVSSLAPALELFNEGQYFAVARRGLDLIVQAKTLEVFAGLKADLDKIALASYFARLTNRLNAENSPEPGMFWLLRNALFAVQLGGDYDIMRIGFELAFLRLSGLGFSFAECASCGGAAESGAHLDAELGGLRCKACGSGAADGLPLSAKALKLAGYVDRFFDAFTKPAAQGKSEAHNREEGGEEAAGKSGSSTISVNVKSTEADQNAGWRPVVSFDRKKYEQEIAELQKAVTFFYRRHFDEPVDRWRFAL